MLAKTLTWSCCMCGNDKLDSQLNYLVLIKDTCLEMLLSSDQRHLCINERNVGTKQKMFLFFLSSDEAQLA